MGGRIGSGRKIVICDLYLWFIACVLLGAQSSQSRARCLVPLCCTLRALPSWRGFQGLVLRLETDALRAFVGCRSLSEHQILLVESDQEKGQETFFFGRTVRHVGS